MIKFKKIIFIVFFCTLIFFALSGCNNNTDDYKEIKDKAIEEISFLDTNILEILNELNNISLENYEVSSKEITTNIQSTQGSEGTSGEQDNSGKETSKSSQGSNSQENSETEKITVSEMEKDFVIIADLSNINWDNIKSKIELLNSYWSIIVIDLYSLNVNNEDIISFSTVLNKTLISIKDENKTSSLTNLAEMYSYIPKYLKAISAQNSTQNIKQTKAYIINAYAIVEQGNWTEINLNIDNAITSFNNVISDIEYAKNNEYKVNKGYVLINDLKNSLSNQDVEMFYIKYKNVIQGLNIM